MGVILKAKHKFKSDITDEALFNDKFNEVLLRVILYLEDIKSN